MANIFHIITEPDWELAKKTGIYSPESLSNEGFIHCSHTDQILEVANSFYKGQKKLLLLRIFEPNVAPEVKHEPPLEAPMSGSLFPHIYGDLNLSAVNKVFEIPVNEDGHFSLPRELLAD